MRPRIQPLVWGSWPPFSRRNQNLFAPDEYVEVQEEEMQATEPETPETSSTEIQETSDENAEVTKEEAPMNVEEETVDSNKTLEPDVSSQDKQPNPSLGRPRPPVSPSGPYYPPGPPTGPYVPPGHPGGSTYPGMMELARVYIPIQRFGPTYSPAEALDKGTLFPELYRPYPY